MSLECPPTRSAIMRMQMVRSLVLCAAFQAVGALPCAGQEIGNGRLTVRLSTVDGSLVVADAESGRTWRSGAEFANVPVEVSDAVKTSPASMVYRVKPRGWQEFTCRMSVDGGELDVALEAPAWGIRSRSRPRPATGSTSRTGAACRFHARRKTRPASATKASTGNWRNPSAAIRGR